MHRVPRGVISLNGRIGRQPGLLALIVACSLCVGCPEPKRISSGSSAPAPADPSLEGLWAGIYGSDLDDTDPEYDQDDQVVQGAGPSGGELRLMMRGRDGSDPLEAVRLYSVLMSEVDPRDASLSSALLRKSTPNQNTFGFIDENYTQAWKSNLDRMLQGAVTQFVPPESGTIPNISSGTRNCTESGSGADQCAVTFAINQPVPLLIANQLAGDVFTEGDLEEPNLIFTADADARPLDQALSETFDDAGRSVFSNETDPANSDTAGDAVVLNADNEADDAFYIGMAGVFESFLVDVSEATGAGHVGVWEYSDAVRNDIVWRPLTGPSPTVFESTGTAFETWTAPANWDAVEVGSQVAFYFVRFRTTTPDPAPASASRIRVATYGAVYESPSSLDDLDGPWQRTGGGAAVDVDTDGSFTGNDSDGGTCTYAGNFTIRDASKNLYGMTMQVANCGDFNSDAYSGLAWIGRDPLDGTEDHLFFHVDNGSYAFGDEFEQTPQ